ncbi:TetR/AcrR family transcriptional regulator [Nocardia otitidiscaviarum]|uniref:TetR/AcrR family transcriptional regulator n=1 Tax=Nocardia otitidiscaviarum TaxID=1823 RepID=A0A516NME6_9NOCA|nr:TetR/AcrR family transcriptional regulator [Nocardia otitidiscaviarum]MCP9624669.1 TetR/AcrR family transcriptional regulator [Nocardia otitidiscaviarum]QDP80074.1 TetR/AcrR family transcriptional regulator [Nocardia otitidiscaviarum]
MAEAKSSRHETRERIVEVAARLLRDKGTHAVTTRAVAQAAGMQAPTIYRFFEDKDALLDAVAEHVFAAYVADKERVDHEDDPVADLRAGWEMHLDFALANPAVFSLLTDPHRGVASPAAAAGLRVLRERVHRVAATGRLRVDESRAVELIHAAGTGVALSLLSVPQQQRDPGLAASMFEAVTRAILTDAQGATLRDARVALLAAVPELPLTDSERALLLEWLRRTEENRTDTSSKRTSNPL